MTVVAPAVGKPPVFIIGSPRSGTTLLRLMMTSHPDLVIPPECGFAMWLRPQFGEWTRDQLADPERAKSLAEAISATRKFDTWGLDTPRIIAAILEARPANYGEACSAVYRLYASSAGKGSARWGDKNNFYLSHIDAIRSTFEGAMFLHIVRDGRDVACSYREVMQAGSDSPYRPELPTAIEDIARRWSADIRLIDRQLDNLPQDRKFEVRYEDLTRDPVQSLESICAWLGLDYSGDMLDFHRKNRELGLEPKATMDWKMRTLSPAAPETVGRYRTLLDSAEISAFSRIAGEDLRNHGYPC